ncbi:MAG: hypothetical protein DRH70_04580 [Candidatus Coatesbacteria bacterium]|nr:MAG: hypothetical protein DRH70_04580 [Candidatus Coatesbacteria bacterium]
MGDPFAPQWAAYSDLTPSFNRIAIEWLAGRLRSNMAAEGPTTEAQGAGARFRKAAKGSGDTRRLSPALINPI